MCLEGASVGAEILAMGEGLDERKETNAFQGGETPPFLPLHENFDLCSASQPPEITSEMRNTSFCFAECRFNLPRMQFEGEF
jgi:hypothetical protein